MFRTKFSLSEVGSSDSRALIRRMPIAFLLFAVQILSASSIPPVIGSYTILQHTPRGSQVHIQVRIHLFNHGSSDVSIQRMTPWDVSHVARGASHACALTVRAHSSLETTQEFLIRRSEYQLWQRGLKPRFLLELGSPSGTGKRTLVVALDRTAPQEAK